jgi:hypothetical protein
MQGLIALLLGSAGGLLIWAILAQQKVSKLRSKYSPITTAEEEAERIKLAENEAERIRLAEEAETIRLVEEEVEQVEERSLTEPEMKKKEEIVKSMKKGLSGFKSRYGKDAKSVMYATATKNAMKD